MATPLPRSTDVAARTSPPAGDREQREHRDQRGAPLGQALGLVRPPAQLDRPVGELRDGEQASRVDGCPRVEAAVAELPRVGARKDDERPRQQRRERPGEPEREEDDRGGGHTAELEPMRVTR